MPAGGDPLGRQKRVDVANPFRLRSRTAGEVHADDAVRIRGSHQVRDHVAASNGDRPDGSVLIQVMLDLTSIVIDDRSGSTDRSRM